MQIEREIKFRLPPAAARRVWRFARPASSSRRRTVTSVYYDTPNQRLRRAGAALRLRRDGRRGLQTLKLESGARAGLAERPDDQGPALLSSRLKAY